jgi:subtilisin family serine protease
VAAPPATAPTEAPRDWQLLDAGTDRVPGTSARRAERELLAGRRPGRTVVVAVIDGGIDTAHVDLKANLWRNPREVAGNGKDDDGNGYVDDVYGWNFLGGANGDNVDWDTLELTREQVRCTSAGASRDGAAAGSSATPSTTAAADSTRERCAEIAEKFQAKRQELQGMSQQIQMMDGMYARVVRVLGHLIPADSLSVERVTALKPGADSVKAARDLFLRMAASGISAQVLKDAREDVQGQLEYGLNPDFNPRRIVGDDPRDGTQRLYGNRDVTGPDAKHGSHVAGIIGAVRDNAGIDGVAGAVQLMAVRAVPNGDEHDKDVANAIRYAVDHGAHIVNMSFGKGYSPGKRLVDDAVKYADSKGVLMIHAAGNDGEDLATAESYPTPEYLGGGRAANWLEVGASSWKGGADLAATFTNYGKERVDLFAPGVDILSTVPGGDYARESGTSMAAPVVSGVAALLMSYFPTLTAADVKQLLLETATPYGDTLVVRPGSEAGEKVRFGDLSRTGGIVNAHAAIKAALARTGSVQ